MAPVGLEPTQLAVVKLESTPLGKVSYHQALNEISSLGLMLQSVASQE